MDAPAPSSPASPTRLLVRIGITLAALFFLYCLSTGPAWYGIVRWRLSHQGHDLPILPKIFMPPDWLLDSALGHPLAAYIGWWQERASGQPSFYPVQ